MPTYQSNKNLQPDTDFRPGTLSLLKVGNQCRRLDKRRTPGIIEAVFPESGMFRWRIMDFEDKGNYWDLPLEEVTKFQFVNNAAPLKPTEADELVAIVEKLDKVMTILPREEDRVKSEAILTEFTEDARHWLEHHSQFFAAKQKLEVTSREGSSALASDLLAHMKEHGLEQLEEKTATIMVLNPSSGEWIKGISIVLAECGLAPYHGKIPRTLDIFEGDGTKEKRREYLLRRLAFVRAFFAMVNITDVRLHRGISYQKKEDRRQTLTSYTFSKDVARELTAPPAHGQPLDSVLEEKVISINKLFMTYLETAAMNRQYKEAEAVVLGE